jgi:hypothetical protein
MRRTEEMFEEPEVVDEDNGKNPRGIEPANHLGVEDLIELPLNGLKAGRRDLSMGHGSIAIISFPPPSANPLSGSSQFQLADLYQTEPT